MKTAVILFSLGGPDRLESVGPFLFNLFNDPAIIRLPGVVRRPLAWLLSVRREPVARDIYRHLGGSSPLLANTEAQARALESTLALTAQHMGTIRTFVAMRYWHPFSQETAQAVKAFAPDRIILLPLYPQWSTTTTASSFREWRRACRSVGLDVTTESVCCYPVAGGFIKALVQLIRASWEEAGAYGKPRILFSAHGLPKRVVASGDPYPWQCEQTALAVVAALALPALDWVNCYQSRVGPLEWIGPATEAEIQRAGRDRVPILVVPIAFVSEHSETLVELDIEYRGLAARCGVPFYGRVPTVGINPTFIDGLADLVKSTLASHCKVATRICPPVISACGYGTERS